MDDIKHIYLAALERISFPKEIEQLHAIFMSAIDSMFVLDTEEIIALKGKSYALVSKFLKEKFLIYIFSNAPSGYDKKDIWLQIKRYDRAFLVTIEDTDLLKNEVKLYAYKLENKRIRSDIYIEADEEKARILKNIAAPVLSQLEHYISDIKEQSANPVEQLHFQRILTPTQQKNLVRIFKDSQYTNAPQALVDFLIGKAVKKGIEIRINDDKLHHIAYLIYRLYNSKPKLIKLNKTKEYQQHFIRHILPFSQTQEKFQIKKLLKEMNGNETLKRSVGMHIDAIMSQLSK